MSWNELTEENVISTLKELGRKYDNTYFSPNAIVENLVCNYETPDETFEIMALKIADRRLPSILENLAKENQVDVIEVRTGLDKSPFKVYRLR